MNTIDIAKQLSAAFQNIVIGEKDSDCGSNGFYKKQLTKGNAKMFKFRYIKEGSGLFLLTPDNIDKYIGKVVLLRSPLYCTDKKICNKCAGDLYYNLGITNVGIVTNRVGTSVLNSSLKAFHDTAFKTFKVDLDSAIR